MVELDIDCDADTILIKANAHGPICNNRTSSCFDGSTEILKQVQDDSIKNFTIKDLEKIIHQRIDDKVEGS